MSAKMQVPLSQRRHTNIAVVRYSKNGVKLEIACYKNKVISYRSGTEDRLDEVLQVDRIFSNVGKGHVASEKDIQTVFGRGMKEKEAIAFMLVHGELQVAQQEREAEVDELFKDISVIISQKCINSVTHRPFPSQVIEQSLRSIGAAVKLDQPVKKQALALIHQLIESQIIPIERAKMKVRCTTEESYFQQLRAWCEERSLEIESFTPEDDISGWRSIVLFLPPHLFREMEDFVRTSLSPGSTLHMSESAVREPITAEGSAAAAAMLKRVESGVDGVAFSAGDLSSAENLSPPPPALSDSAASDTQDTAVVSSKKNKNKRDKKGKEPVSSSGPTKKGNLRCALQSVDGEDEDSDDEQKKGKKGKRRKKGHVDCAVPKPSVKEPESEEDSDAEVEGNRRQRKKTQVKKSEVPEYELGDEEEEDWGE